MTQDRLTTEQLHTLGMGDMSLKARDALMMQLGRTVFAEAMVRLLDELNEEQVYALNYAIEATDDFMAVMQYVEETYPRFVSYLEEAKTQQVRTLAEDLSMNQRSIN